MKDNGIPTDALEDGKKKLLIVDDDQDLVELMQDAFERDGRFEIRTANNGFAAGMGVKEFRPDIVVLDVMLPDINGKEVLSSRAQRQDPGLGKDHLHLRYESKRTKWATCAQPVRTISYRSRLLSIV